MIRKENIKKEEQVHYVLLFCLQYKHSKFLVINSIFSKLLKHNKMINKTN